MNGIFQENFNNVTIFSLGDDTFSAAFSSGCSIKVKEENGFISLFSVTAPSSFKGLTTGIMGNYNGNTTDDLMARNSTEPLPHNSSIEAIHDEFGITCKEPLIYIYYDDVIFQRSRLVFILAHTRAVHGRFGIYSYTHLGAGCYIIKYDST